MLHPLRLARIRHLRVCCRLSYADSNNLGDLRELSGHVLDSDVVVLLQSEDVLTRPWCLLELYAAATAGIPIVSLVCSGKGYDFAASEDHLLHLDTGLAASNPSVIGLLEAHDAPVLRVAHVLWACLPSTICVPLNSSGSENAIRAAVADLVKAMQRAKAIPVPADEEAWLKGREARDGAALAKVVASSTIRGTQRGRMLQKLERADEIEQGMAKLRAELEDEREKREVERAEHKAELKDEREKREVERSEHKAELAGAMSKLESRNEKLEAKLEKLEAKLVQHI